MLTTKVNFVMNQSHVCGVYLIKMARARSLNKKRRSSKRRKKRMNKSVE